MKKIIKSSLFVLAAVAVSVACSKEMSPVIPGNQVTITAYIPDELTKVSFTPDANLDGPVKIAWEDLDKIRVIDHNDATDNSQFAIQPGFTAHQASFSGTPVEATSYDILYPGTMESVAEAEAVQFGIQTQTNNANAAQLAYMALLSNVNTYESVEFSEAWATAHGGSFKQTGILRLRIQLPDGFTGDVASVTVNAPSALFYKSNALISKEKVSSLKLNFTGAGATPDAGVITGYVMLPWENVTIAANTTLSVIVETADHKFYTKSFTPSTTEDVVLTMGRVNAIKINKTGFGAASTTFAGGSGTAADPWLIANKTHMENIAGNLRAGETKYFKLIDDIDMTGVEWTPVVTASPWNRHIDFDGNYKTIINLEVSDKDYASLFGVFHGRARNFSIKDAVITPKDGTRVGVFAGLIGTIDYTTVPCTIENVTIERGAVGTTSSRSTTRAGILAGEIRANTDLIGITIVGGGVYGSSYTGALCGQTCDYVTSINVTDCHSSGVVNSEATCVGGLIGYDQGSTVMSNSSASGSITGKSSVGGVIGWSTGTQSYTNCWYEGNSITATESSESEANVGGFCGKVGVFSGTIKGCYVYNPTSSVSITATKNFVGGFLGNAGGSTSTSTVEECYVRNVNISGGQYSGGFAGGLYLSSSKCYVKQSSITVNANDVGGFAGYARYGTTQNCYSTLSISAGTRSNIGGFVGTNRSTITNCYASGAVSSTGSKVGSFVGYNNTNGNISKCISVSSSLDFYGTNAATVASNCQKNDAINTYANTLGWSSTIWNLDVNPPILK